MGRSGTDSATESASPDGDAPRRRRADAKRNVAAVLEAAKTVFASTGVDAPAKEITDLAGVGVGTLYRHYPRRADLIVAVLQHEVDACAGAAATLGAALEPWDALAAWIGQFTEFVGTKHGLAAALHSGDLAYDGLPGRLMERLEPALDGLLRRARAAALVRPDVTARDVLLAVVLLCQPVPGEDPRFNERVVRIFVEGLRRS